MSDSESSEDLEVKVELEHEAKVRELIERAKQILPGYSEESLFNIYKESFMTESVFLNKVDIIVKQQRLTQEEGENEDDWHYSRKGERSAPQSRKFGAERSRTAREKYNFLEDANLIQRALKFRRNDAPRERPQQYKEKVERREEGQPRDRQDAKKDKVNQSYKEKKVLYKQKEENGATKNEQKPIVQYTEKIEKTEKPEKIQKAQKIVKVENAEKVEEASPKPAKGYTEKKTKYAQKKQESKPQIKESPKEQPKVAEVAPAEPKKVETKQPETKPTVVQNAPTAPFKCQQAHKPAPKVEAPQPVVPQKVQSISLTKPATISIESRMELTKKIDSEKEILDPEVQREFQNSLNQNSFILKFIKPKSKLQIVTYVRYPDGSWKNVYVREPLAQNN